MDFGAEFVHSGRQCTDEMAVEVDKVREAIVTNQNWRSPLKRILHAMESCFVRVRLVVSCLTCLRITREPHQIDVMEGTSSDCFDDPAESDLRVDAGLEFLISVLAVLKLAIFVEGPDEYGLATPKGDECWVFVPDDLVDESLIEGC